MAGGQLEVPNPHHARVLVGERGENMKVLERCTRASVSVRGNRVILGGEREDVELCRKSLESLMELVEKGFPLTPGDVKRTVEMVRENQDLEVAQVLLDTIPLGGTTRPIAPKSLNQKQYVDAIRGNTVVFAMGPAGTGKTYLAVAMAMASLMNREFRRIVLTRPAVEAGEKLGFLPGDIADKVNPYLRPLYDALEDLSDVDRVHKFIEKGIIEIAPLAFMRGRTLNDSFVILDEAQNTTPEQMKMFLTRLGFNSKAVVTGDATQVDLPPEKQSGLVQAATLLEGLEDIAVCRFNHKDVVRHPVVARIVEAYARADEALRPSPLPRLPD